MARVLPYIYKKCLRYCLISLVRLVSLVMAILIYKTVDCFLEGIKTLQGPLQGPKSVKDPTDSIPQPPGRKEGLNSLCGDSIQNRRSSESRDQNGGISPKARDQNTFGPSSSIIHYNLGYLNFASGHSEELKKKNLIRYHQAQQQQRQPVAYRQTSTQEKAG